MERRAGSMLGTGASLLFVAVVALALVNGGSGQRSATTALGGSATQQSADAVGDDPTAVGDPGVLAAQPASLPLPEPTYGASLLTPELRLSGLEGFTELPSSLGHSGEAVHMDAGTLTITRYLNGPLGEPTTTRIIITHIQADAPSAISLDDVVAANSLTPEEAAAEGAGEGRRDPADATQDTGGSIAAADAASEGFDQVTEVEVAVGLALMAPQGSPSSVRGFEIIRALPGFAELYFEQADGSLINIFVKGPLPEGGLLHIAERLEG